MPHIYEHRDAIAPEGGTPSEVERIDTSDGILIYLKGHECPIKSFPSETAIVAINICKKLLPFLFIPFFSVRARQACMFVLRGVIMRKEFMTPCARELRAMMGESDVALIVAHIIEYDSAYRTRLQYMLYAVTCNDLASRPIRALIAMSKANRRHDTIGVHRKIRRALFFVGFFLVAWPPYRRTWREIVGSCKYVRLLPDVHDHYWFNQRTDYGPLNGNPITTHGTLYL